MNQFATYRRILWVLCLAMAIGSCRTMRFVPEDEKLYVGGDVNLTSTAPLAKRGKLESELEDLLQPKPNKKFLLGRWGLWAHYKGTRERSSFITRYANKKFGEEPVYLSNINIEKTSNLIANRLENKGYFYPIVSPEVVIKKKKAEINYAVIISEPYRLQQYLIPDADSIPLLAMVKSTLGASLLPPGSRFDLTVFKAERERINQYVRERGYYHFNPDYLIFRLDTNQYTNRYFDVYLSLKSEIPQEATTPYEIGDIYVSTDYNVDESTVATGVDTISYAGMHFVQQIPRFNIKYLPEYILLEKGQLYDQRKHRLTTNRLAAIGNFKFVSTRFTPLDSLNTDEMAQLRTEILLSPHNRRTIRAEVQAITKSNSFAGPGLLLSFRNRNLFKGGEILEMNAKAAYETQFSKGERTGLNTTEFSLRNSLTIPRIIAPFKMSVSKGYSVPSTRFGLSLSSLNRMQYYRLGAVQATYGFHWWASRYVSHEITPVALNLMYTSNKTEAFKEILAANPFLDRSFESQFIPGLKYVFRYNGLINQNRIHRFYMEAGLDVAGNLFNVTRRIIGAEVNDQMFGLRFANFTRFDVDFRHYFKTSNETRLVSRLFVGIGQPHGRSTSLPYIKQYFSGGPNSLRAFVVRSVGPGAYTPSTVATTSFFDQSGDIKMEGNVEFRFPMVSYLKGAVFMDAGNIWLARENPALPGAKFTSQWRKQIALGTGMGFRLDFDFLLVRLDLGIPLHDPSKLQADKWISRVAPWERDWRKDFFTWNFAIGYPF